MQQARQSMALDRGRARLGPVAARRKAVRDKLEEKRSRHEKGYVYTMGYGNCVGRYSPGHEFPRFSGSSLNRRKQKIYHGEVVENRARNTIALVGKVAIAVYRKLGREPESVGFVPGADGPVVSRPGREAAKRFKSGFRLYLRRHVDGLCYGIHVLSARSRGKIKDKATAFYRACPGSRIFLTLTFIAAVDDNTGVSILNKFLTAVRSKMKALQYLWVAERQTKNPETPNNIHFHVILNKRLPVKEFNNLWVLQQYNAGLRGRTQYGKQISQAEINERYKKGTIQKVLNPLDVRRVRSIGGLSGYLTKYITKQEKDVPFGCAVWHCSRGVSRLFTKTVVSPSAFRSCMSFHNGRLDKETGELFDPTMIVKQFWIMVYINNKSLPLKYLGEMEQINKWQMQGTSIEAVPLSDDNDYRKHFICEN
jgi:hypothetical protein